MMCNKGPDTFNKGLGFLDADGREEAAHLGINKFERLAVNHGVELLKHRT